MNTAHVSALPNQRNTASFIGNLMRLWRTPGMKTRWLLKDNGALGQRSSDVVQFGEMNVAVARAAAVAYKLELTSCSPKGRRFLRSRMLVRSLRWVPPRTPMLQARTTKRLNFWAIRPEVFCTRV